MRRSDTCGSTRTTLLDQGCGTETAIRNAIEDLLREHDSAGSFLSRPVWDAAQTEPGADCARRAGSLGLESSEQS